MADAHKRRANVDIDHDVHEDLKKVKTDNGLKKMGDAVRVLADHYFGRVDTPESEENEGEDAGEPEKRRKINVREELYSLEILSERDGILEYYTGFNRSEVDLLVRRFSEVRRERVFFPLLQFYRDARPRYDPCATISCPTCRSSNPSFLIGGRATKGTGSLICLSELLCSSLG
jgi:hypothetical protein